MNNTEITQFQTEQPHLSESMLPLSGEYRLIDVDLIEPNPDQPRINCTKEALDELIRSIHENGLIQPIIVQMIEDHYQIIAGERRWRAYLLMGKQQIEAIVKSVDDSTRAIAALAENIAREDLTDYEIGKAIRNIEDHFPSKKDLAAMIGINRTDLYRFLAFDSLPRYILKDLDRNPKLLSRSAAESIKQVLSSHPGSSQVESFLEQAWELLLKGKLQQTQIARYIQNQLKEVCGVDNEQPDNSILNKDGVPVGRIAKSKNQWSIKLLVDKVTDDQQHQILAFIQQLLNDSSDPVSQLETEFG